MRLYFDSIKISDRYSFFFCGKSDELFLSSFDRENLLDSVKNLGIELVNDGANKFLFQDEIREFFSGRLKRFRTRPAFISIPPFYRKVLLACHAHISFGCTVPYSELARITGKPGAVRAVGSAMRSNPLPVLVPCHRVINKNGERGNYSGGKDIKNFLLDFEQLQTV